MLEVIFPHFPTLQTPRLLLREVTPSDAPAIFIMRSDERVMRYLGRPLHKELSETVTLIEAYRKNFDQAEGVTWAICFRDQPNLLGTITFWKMDKVNHRAEIGYSLSADYWRQGIMDEAMTAAIEFYFKTLNFHSIEANTAPENEASGRIWKSMGLYKRPIFGKIFTLKGNFLIPNLLKNQSVSLSPLSLHDKQIVYVPTSNFRRGCRQIHTPTSL